ncbi:mercuric reductase [Thermaerobacter marianensis DSM 12885]|uniref:Mercuric reductase n=1 Tax=Thermaerobacter marianensis (strain ATCC 700841 / DSM 12885 / JCM 10246 / 7p75a) TaxID=644966 RepID=E6SH53_THEM7|nr:mercuric reductase [Thermaerobacter marianensis DSM 12885]
MSTLKPGRYHLAIEGMTCAHCATTVQLALEQAGARAVEADFRRGVAVFDLPQPADPEDLRAAVRGAGYQPGALARLEPGDGCSQAAPAPQAVRAAQSSPAPHASPASKATPRQPYDLVIVGSGSAAFAAAIEASQGGARVAMVERGVVGGTCVNIGCVPSKTLLRAAEIYFRTRHHPFAGIATQAGPVDLPLLIGQKNELVSRLRYQKYERLVDTYGFDLLRGEGRFLDAHTLQVVDPQNGEVSRTLEARAFLIATGAAPAVPDVPGLEAVDFLTSTSALDLRRLPESVAVIGAGYIALELGQFFRHLGAQVTIMQRSPELLKAYDPEIRDAVRRMLDEHGIEVLTGVRYLGVDQAGGLKRVRLEVAGVERAVEAEALLVATGRRPNTAALQLDRAGVRTGLRGEVVVDEQLRTSVPHIFAAGDVTMGPQFVYVAAYQGALAARNAVCGAEERVDLRAVPRVTFTTPAIASVGLTEEQARAAGHRVRASVLPLETVPRALANRETTGVYKLVADADTGRLLGAHVVAENAGDVIYAATLAVKFGLTIEDLRSTLAPYLTMAEGLKLAALGFKTEVSNLSCCAG